MVAHGDSESVAFWGGKNPSESIDCVAVVQEDSYPHPEHWEESTSGN